jgi:hypothetical protein
MADYIPKCLQMLIDDKINTQKSLRDAGKKAKELNATERLRALAEREKENATPAAVAERTLIRSMISAGAFRPLPTPPISSGPGAADNGLLNINATRKRAIDTTPSDARSKRVLTGPRQSSEDTVMTDSSCGQELRARGSDTSLKGT